MAKLLYIESSPRKARSASIGAARAFLESYKESHPNDEVEVLDLWAVDLPEITEEILNIRYALGSGQALTSDQEAAWGKVVQAVEHFKSADKYVFSVPMWNFNVPYKLKHYMDAITHPGLTFSFSPETGYQGLVTGKPVTVVYSRGGEYREGPAQAYDQQTKYMEQWLGFIGFTDVRAIFVEPTLNPAKADQAKQAARQTAVASAVNF